MSDTKRSLPGIYFNVPKTEVKNEVKKEVGHSIDQENYDSEEYSIILEDHMVIFPT